MSDDIQRVTGELVLPEEVAAVQVETPKPNGHVHVKVSRDWYTVAIGCVYLTVAAYAAWYGYHILRSEFGRKE